MCTKNETVYILHLDFLVICYTVVIIVAILIQLFFVTLETDGQFEQIALWDTAWDGMQCSAVCCAFLHSGEIVVCLYAILLSYMYTDHSHYTKFFRHKEF